MCCISKLQNDRDFDQYFTLDMKYMSMKHKYMYGLK